MKKLILTLALILSLSTYAQHLQFKGVEIKGTPTLFAQKLKGFVKVQSKIPNTIKLLGTFAGLKGCEVYIQYTAKSKTLTGVTVFTKNYDSWYLLEDQYTKLKDQLSEKYEIFKDVAEFYEPYYLGDGYELQALRTENCDYSCSLRNELGYIYLTICKSGFISISYQDKKGIAISIQEENSVINKDI